MTRNKKTLNVLILLGLMINGWFFCLLPPLFCQSFSDHEKMNTPGVLLGKADLQRQSDVIFLKGENIPGLCGQAKNNMQVIVYKDNQIHSIPFQIDEHDINNELVFPYGEKASTETAPADSAAFGSGPVGSPSDPGIASF